MGFRGSLLYFSFLHVVMMKRVSKMDRFLAVITRFCWVGGLIPNGNGTGKSNQLAAFLFFLNCFASDSIRS